jgi:hypothetical protein
MVRKIPRRLHRPTILRARAITSSPGTPVSRTAADVFCAAAHFRPPGRTRFGIANTVFGEYEAIYQFGDNVIGPLLRFFHDLIERQGYAESVHWIKAVSTLSFLAA